MLNPCTRCTHPRYYCGGCNAWLGYQLRVTLGAFARKALDFLDAVADAFMLGSAKELAEGVLAVFGGLFAFWLLFVGIVGLRGGQ